MKTEINEHGVLVIAGENMVESMALTTWHEAWKRRGATLRVHVLQPATEQVDVFAPTQPGGLEFDPIR